MKCAIYSRVSTDRQAEEGFSLPAQKERMVQFINSQGWTMTDEYVDDGYSAKNIDRPSIQRLLRDMKTGKFEVVVVYKLDRLVRSITDLHHLLTEFDRHNVKFKSVTENFDTTSAIGRMFISLTALLAQWERETISERVVVGMAKKATDGGRAGAIAPYGYSLAEDGNLVVNPEESKWVRYIFESYKRNGLRAIALELNKRNVKSRRGLTWIASTLQYIIENPVYIGALRWHHTGKSKGDTVITYDAHEPIINVELFEEVQAIRKERSSKGQKPKSDYAFSGLLKCGRCGGRLMGAKYQSAGIERRVYRCKDDRARVSCDMPMLPEDVIAEWFLGHDFLNDLELNDYTPPKKEVDSDTESLRKELAKIEDALTRMKKLYTWGEMDEKEYREESKLLRERTKEINGLLDETEITYASLDDVKKVIEELRKWWPKLPHRGRQEALRTIFEEITVNVITKSRRHIPAVIEVLDYQVR
jgi:site-specific DNA recombinase